MVWPQGDDADGHGAQPLYVRFGGAGAAGADTLVSRTALRLHVYSVLASIEAGRPGLVTDAYLDAVTAETTVAAIELCTAGMWARVDGGYRVAEVETMRLAGEVHRQLAALTARCRAGGGHTADPEHAGQCRECGVQRHHQVMRSTATASAAHSSITARAAGSGRMKWSA